MSHNMFKHACLSLNRILLDLHNNNVAFLGLVDDFGEISSIKIDLCIMNKFNYYCNIQWTANQC